MRPHQSEPQAPSQARLQPPKKSEDPFKRIGICASSASTWRRVRLCNSGEAIRSGTGQTTSHPVSTDRYMRIISHLMGTRRTQRARFPIHLRSRVVLTGAYVYTDQTTIHRVGPGRYARAILYLMGVRRRQRACPPIRLRSHAALTSACACAAN